jgi:polyhydroxyalkanoate synthase subunit PhaC
MTRPMTKDESDSGGPTGPSFAIPDMSAALQAVSAMGGPDVGMIADPDPALMGRALAATATGAARHPIKGAELTIRLGTELVGAGLAAVSRTLGSSASGPLPVDPKDRRFADPAWESNPAFFAIRQAYLALRKYTLDLADIATVDPSAEAKADMALGILTDALAPTNFLPTNPAALKRAFDTGGRSLVAGLRNFADDLLHNGGYPRQVDTTPFEVGGNLAVTPAKVVYRNDLIEVLQYLPQTDQVHQIPILCSPPWINKYYIMDLAPQRSFIEWAVQRGHTVFTISYRNPDASMSGTTLDDYLTDGPRTALDVVCGITGSDTVHVVGLCLGGAMTVMMAAYLAGIGDNRIGSITLLNTLVDYSMPGALGTFTDTATVAKLDKKLARKGYLDGRQMAASFNFMRPNDLIFNYVVSNWLMGESPPAFDILAWNGDNTNMPAAMHSFYIRSLFVENRLVSGDLELAGRRLDVSEVKQPLYIVAAINDHIVLWQASYQTLKYVPGPVRFVLSSGGHIAGIVNPPGPKAWYMTAEGAHPTPEAWHADAEKHAASWWEDWAEWAAEHGGPMVDPPRIGSDEHPVLGDGPGEYVHG